MMDSRWLNAVKRNTKYEVKMVGRAIKPSSRLLNQTVSDYQWRSGCWRFEFHFESRKKEKERRKKKKMKRQKTRGNTAVVEPDEDENDVVLSLPITMRAGRS